MQLELLSELLRLNVFKTQILGLVGNSGSGKSSLIDCLLNVDGLASHEGNLCTDVVTECHFHDRADFIIHFDFYSAQELKTHVLTEYAKFATSQEALASSERIFGEDIFKMIDQSKDIKDNVKAIVGKALELSSQQGWEAEVSFGTVREYCSWLMKQHRSIPLLIRKQLVSYT